MAEPKKKVDPWDVTPSDQPAADTKGSTIVGDPWDVPAGRPITPEDLRPDPEAPTFMRNFNRQVNPVTMVSEFVKAAKAQDKSDAEFYAANPGYFRRVGYEAGKTGQMTLGMLLGLPMLAIDTAKELGNRQYGAAGGTAAGGLLQFILFRGLDKWVKAPKKALSARQALQTDAAQSLHAAEARIPMGRSADDIRKAEIAAYEAGLAQQFQRYEGVAGRGTGSTHGAASNAYSFWNKLLRRFPSAKGTPLKWDKAGKPSVIADTELYALTDVGPLRNDLESFAFNNSIDPYPVGHPVGEFLKAFGTEAGNVKVPLDTLKKAAGRLSILIRDPRTKPSYRGIAQQLLKKTKPHIEAKLRYMAKETGMSIKKLKANLAAADRDWASYNALTASDLPGIPAARSEWNLQHAATRTPPRVPPSGTPYDLQSMKDAARTSRELTAAKRAAERNVSGAKNIDRLTIGEGAENALATFTTHGGSASEVLSSMFHDMINLKDYGRWAKVSPRVKARLTAHDPGLEVDITNLMDKLQKLQTEFGPGGAKASAEAVKAWKRMYRVATGFAPHLLTGELEDRMITPASVARLNGFLDSIMKRLPRRPVPRSLRTATVAGMIGGVGSRGIAAIPERIAEKDSKKKPVIEAAED